MWRQMPPVALLYSTIQETARMVFSLGAMASFDEGGVPIRRRCFPVRQYNKDQPDKYRVGFFTLEDAESILSAIWMFKKARTKTI